MEKNYGAVELFSEKTGDVVRIIRFCNYKEFCDFLDSFKKMRYPGYSWRFRNKKKRGMKKVE